MDAWTSSRKWTFFGRVLPERVPITASTPGMELFAPGLSVNIRIKTNIHASQVVCDVEVKESDTDVYTLRNLVESSIRSFIDIVGFHRGMSLDVEILSASSADGEWFVFGIEIPSLFDYSAGPSLEIDLTFLKNALSDQATPAMLADFREAMRVPLQTGFFCYHAIEACMQSFRDREGLSAKDGWDSLRSKLNVERPAIDAVKKHADWFRHGQNGSISDEERKTIFGITHEIIRRYLIFVNSGFRPLSDADYPLLTLS